MYQHNNMTRGYENYMNRPVSFMNNQMFANNPLYASNIRNQTFYQQMMRQKEEQIRKIKNVKDLNLDEKQIVEYVIQPIKLAKNDPDEIERLFDTGKVELAEEYIKQNWWKTRTNAPYKNILKNEDWRKEFKNKEDLIVHKVTDLDKIGLMKDYNKLKKIIKRHNGKLKKIFSVSKENEHKQNFEYVRKMKERIKYNPKDYDDLKNFYKKEQKKFNREQKRTDKIIARLMYDDIDEKEIKRLEAELVKTNPQKVTSSTKSKTIDKEKIKKRNKKHDLDEEDKLIDKKLQEIVEEYGEDILDSDTEDTDSKSDNDDVKEKVNEKQKKTKKNKQKMKSKSRSRSRSRSNSDTNNATNKPRIRIKLPMKKKDNDTDIKSDNPPDNQSNNESDNKLEHSNNTQSGKVIRARIVTKNKTQNVIQNNPQEKKQDVVQAKVLKDKNISQEENKSKTSKKLQLIKNTNISLSDSDDDTSLISCDNASIISSDTISISNNVVNITDKKTDNVKKFRIKRITNTSSANQPSTNQTTASQTPVQSTSNDEETKDNVIKKFKITRRKAE